MRCVHYMFKQKVEKIDFNFLTWHNLMKLYQQHKTAAEVPDEFEMIDDVGSVITNEKELLKSSVASISSVMTDDARK